MAFAIAGCVALLTSALALLLALLSDLESISTMGSAGFLLIFAAVNAANARLHRETGSRLWISVLGVIACLAALGALVWQTLRTQPFQLWVLAAMLGTAFAIEVGYRVIGRELKLRSDR